MSNRNNDHYFLKGGGEMGELFRAKDWSKTPLGDPAGWPKSLCTMVAMMLDNPFGMYIAWGNDYTQLYNDGYRPILGATKHPQALGISTRETFSEIWHIIESMFDGVMNGKAVGFPDFMLPLNRNGFVEECYFDFSYSPIRKDDGEVGGVMVTVIETTSKKKTEENLKESEQDLRSMALQAPIGICILDAATLICEIVNDRFIEIAGKSRESIAGKYYWDIFAEAKPYYVSALNKVVREGNPFFAKELKIMRKRNGKEEIMYVRFVYAPLKDEEGNVKKVTVWVLDLTHQVMARRKIEEDTEKLNIVIDASELGTWVLNLKTKESTYSKRYLEILGGYKEDIQLTHEQLLQHLHPDDLLVREKAFKEAFITGNLHYKGRLIWNDNSIHWMEGKGKVYYDENNIPIKMLGTIRDITVEKNQEEELRKSEEQFSTLADNMENLAWLADGEGWIYWYNKRWLEYTGFTLEEMQGWGWQKVHHPEHVNRIVEVSKKIWQTNQTFELTFPLRRHDGVYRWFLTRGHPISNEEGKIIRWIGTNTDIDEQKKAEEQFKVLADQAPMWVWLTDKEVNVLYTNPEVLKFLGIAHYKDFTGNMWEQKVHPDDIEMVYRSFGEAASLQQSFSFEFRVQNAMTLQYEWYYIKGVPRLEEGEFTGFIGTGININEQKTLTKELEEKVISRTAELKASEEKFYRLFNLSPISKTLTDAQSGKIVMVNDTFLQVFGYSRKETYDKTTAELGLFEPKQREILIKELKENGKIQNKEIEFTMKSGKKFFALTSAEIINIGDKQYFLGAYNDISDRKKAEKNIEQKNLELEKMNKELQSFAYISSHDLQEPLRKIQTFATRIIEKEENNLSDYGRDMFQRMQEAANRMQTLIQDLLAYSRITISEHQLQTTDLNTIISEVKEDLKEELEEKNATIDSTQLCVVHIIPFQFRQLMNNLISNSIKFSNPDKPLHILIKSEILKGKELNNKKLSPQTKYCHITVSDNGIGFDQQFSEKIFEVFQRLHSKNEYSGTGIGLSIVKKIVENHKGIITAIGEINKGATIEIYIPVS